MDSAKLTEAKNYSLTGGGAGYITRSGKLVMSWGSPTQRGVINSTTKSIGVTALGLAIQDGLMNLSDFALTHYAGFGVPPIENETTGWLPVITILQLATHTAGFDGAHGFGYLRVHPGTDWSYSNGGANWLADLLTVTYMRDLKDLMFERVFTPIGISSTQLTWQTAVNRPLLIEGINRREFGRGISASADAMARIGLLYLRNGMWNGQQIIPPAFINVLRTAVPSVVGLPERPAGKYFNASDHYGLLWWNNANNAGGPLANVPTDAYWSWGASDSIILVIPSLDIVAVRRGKGFNGIASWNGNYAVLKPFFEPIVTSVTAYP